MIKLVTRTITKGSNTAKLVFLSNIRDVIFISIGVTMASIGLKGFLLPNKFLDGEQWACHCL